MGIVTLHLASLFSLPAKSISLTLVHLVWRKIVEEVPIFWHWTVPARVVASVVYGWVTFACERRLVI